MTKIIFKQMGQEDFMLTMTKNRLVSFRKAPKSPLSTMDFFKNLPPNAFLEIEKHMTEKKYAKRETLFLEGDPASFLWFVEEGHIKEISHSAEGRSNTLSMVGPNGMFGISAFNGGEYGFHCVAETDATVISFPIRIFQVLMGKYPEMAGAIVSQISRLLRHSKDMQTFSQESAERRLLHVLVDMVEEFGSTIPLTRREIAEMAGTAVETCIRTFCRLEDKGFISSVHGKLMIKSVDRLKAHIEKL